MARGFIGCARFRDLSFYGLRAQICLDFAPVAFFVMSGARFLLGVVFAYACWAVKVSAADLWQTNTAFDFIQGWKYQTNNLEGPAWRQMTYDDALWSEGPGLLFIESAALPAAKMTPLPPRPAETLPWNTYYFRTYFVLSNTPTVTSLIFSNLIDDGAVFYFNGGEIRRVGMGDGAVTNGTSATRDVGDATSFDIFQVSGPTLAALREGTNLLAVEVHQSTAQSSDVVFGSSLTVVQDPAAARYVWLVSPTNGQTITVGTPVNVAAFVSTVFSNVSRVDFLTDEVVFAGDDSPPFSAEWAGQAAGGHTLSAVAYGAQGLTATSQLVTVSLVLPPAPRLTRGPYLQLGTPQSVVVRWRTDVPSSSLVAYGTNLLQLDQSVFAGGFTTNHSLRLTNLTPGTLYYYSVGSHAGELAPAHPQQYYFTSPGGGSVETIRIWVIGDAGTANSDQVNVRNAYQSFIGTNHTDVWLQLGDNAYPLGTDGQYQRAVFQVYTNLLPRTVTWPALGNHDTGHAIVFTNTYPYFEIFDLPAQGEAGGVPSGFEQYYSFDYGNVHFICLDSMTSDLSTNGPMANWLRADLAANTNLWVIAYCHHAPYSKGSHDSDTELPLIQVRQNLLPILEAGGLDLFLAGHSHVYERTHLLDGHYSHSTLLATNMITMIGGGAETNQFGPYRKPAMARAGHQGAVYVVMGSSGQLTPGPLTHTAMHTAGNVLGSFYLEVNGKRLDGSFIRETGAIDDRFTIVKGEMTNRLASLEALGNDSYFLRGFGVPGRTHEIESADYLSNPNWRKLGDARAATNGVFPFFDFGSTNANQQFYRARQ